MGRLEVDTISCWQMTNSLCKLDKFSRQVFKSWGQSILLGCISYTEHFGRAIAPMVTQQEVPNKYTKATFHRWNLLNLSVPASRVDTHRSSHSAISVIMEVVMPQSKVTRTGSGAEG